VTDATETSSPDRPSGESILGGVARRREVHLGGISLSGRRRRPSGEKPPLPRNLEKSGWFWLGAGALAVVVWASIFAFPATVGFWLDVDLRILDWFVDRRSGSLTDVMRVLHALGSGWFIRPLRWAMIGVLVSFRRWRTLFGVIAAFVIVDTIVRGLADTLARPRPFVEIIGDWAGYSHPSAPVALLAVTLVVGGLALVPRGRWRTSGFVLSGVAVSLLAVARMYLGVDHPSDAGVGLMVGPSVGVLVFRFLVPESIYPVSYGRTRAAHLDVSGRRGEAIRAAFQEQLGISVDSVEPFGLEGSGGSTPLRVECADGEARFAKLYARSHLRADRWYKVARTILYGSLEDEVRFASVRRLVEYEDYILLKLNEAGLPSPRPYGIVEITPEREYAIVTEFLDDAKEIGKADVDEQIMDQALMIVRRLWDAGLAHRDIKPANVMVRDGEVVLIDPAFATVRPSPWRQAVDLANMMIILALRTSPERTYERALQFFSPADIAEAFAATRGVTIPSQSRSSLALFKRQEGVDIVERFRALAPSRDRIVIQRWSLRRIALTLGAILAALFMIELLVENLSGAGFI